MSHNRQTLPRCRPKFPLSSVPRNCRPVVSTSDGIRQHLPPESETYHHPHVYLRRPASRILWFLTGADVAVWWNHSPATRDYHSLYWSCLTRQDRRAALQDQPHGTGSESEPYERDTRWGWKPILPSSGVIVGWNEQEWEENKERLRDTQKRVSEAMVAKSESMLESTVSTAEALKAYLP
ncbi:hypothetical protein EDD16DRAFT_1703314 [Pisolithus croceorrhizus]|nr:hypothetical protein EV401DRAFT_2208827 [Pisolithus croceorrhizus]KAI6125454.1 hypothetical protein EDD16DRAFT_1703314 [Pisolithus croceorrhizus]